MSVETSEDRAALPPSSHQYLPWLDGLRAVSVFGVLLFHHDEDVFSGGFIGVDVFFVLSGYLITSLLVREFRGSGRIAYRRFWSRRLRRLLPTLLVTVALAVGLNALLVRSDHPISLRQESFAALMYVDNWYRLRTVSTVLGHTWSLAIEMQFYVAWPLALALIVRACRTSRSTVIAVVSLLACSSALWTAWLVGRTALTRAYFGTDTRAQLLLIGALVSLVVADASNPSKRDSQRARAWVEVGGIVGAVVVLGIGLTVKTDSLWYYRGGMALVGFGSAAILMAGLRGTGIVRRFLEWKPLVAMGRISYGIYLLHFPLYRLLTEARLSVGSAGVFVIRVLVVVGASGIVFVLVERPIIRGALRAPRFGVAVAAGVAIAFVSTLVATPRSDGLGLRRLREDLAQSEAAEPRVLVIGVGENSALTRAVRLVGARPAGVVFATECFNGPGDLWIEQIRVTPDPDCSELVSYFADAVRVSNPSLTVFVPDVALVASRIVDGVVRHPGDRDLEVALRSWFGRVSAAVSGESGTFAITTPICPALVDAALLDRLEWLNTVVRRWAEATDGVALIDLGSSPCSIVSEQSLGVMLGEAGDPR